MDCRRRLDRSGLLLGLAMVAALVGVGPCAAASITYSVDQTIGAGSVVGTIQTDGAIGVLGTGDFTAWNLTLNGVGASSVIKNSDFNAAILVQGADVTATASDLYFNFSGPDGGLLLFQDGLFSGTLYYCDAASSGTCYQGATVTPQSIFDASAQNVAAGGNQIIGVAATPLPATWTMLICGSVGLGFFAYRGTRTTSSTIAAT